LGQITQGVMLSLNGAGYVATPVVQPSISAATYIAWFRTTMTGNGVILSGRQNMSTTDGNLTLCIGSFYGGKTGAIEWGFDTAGNAVGVTTNLTFNDGNLHCVIATMNGVSGNAVSPSAFAITVDGVDQATYSSTAGGATFPLAGTNDIYIGLADNGNYFSGQLAHAAILFGTAVTSAQRTAIYQNGLSMTVANYEAYLQSLGFTNYWPLQETSGTTAANLGSAGSANNGTYTGTYTLGSSGGPPAYGVVSTSPPAPTTATPTSGTAWQNTMGADVVLTLPVTYNPTSTAAATLAVGVGATSTPTQSTWESVPAGAVAGSIRPLTVYVPVSWYVLLTATNATLGTATVAPA